MGRTIGLDFGTTNTRVHLGSDTGSSHISVIDLPEADRGALPSVILLDDAGGLARVGRSAEEALQNPALVSRVRYEFKPCLGRSAEDLEVQSDGALAQMQCPSCGEQIPEGFRFCGRCGKPLPEQYLDLMAERALKYQQDEAFEYAEHLLRQVGLWLRSRALGGSWETDDKLVAGVPVHWGDATRSRYTSLLRGMLEAPCVELLDEPQAALAEYLSRECASVGVGDTILVVDIGGGTTDLVAGVVWQQGRLDNLRRHGVRYGGSDLDDAVTRWACDQLGVSVEEAASPLRATCRNLKEMLSDAVKAGLDGENPERRTMAMLPMNPPIIKELVLDRLTFEGPLVAGRLIQYFEAMLAENMQELNASPDAVRHVLLIGGGSNCYFIEDAARRVFTKARIVAGQQPELAISRGLALGMPRWSPPSPGVGTSSATHSVPPEVPTQASPQPSPTSGGTLYQRLTDLLSRADELARAEDFDEAWLRLQEAELLAPGNDDVKTAHLALCEQTTAHFLARAKRRQADGDPDGAERHLNELCRLCPDAGTVPAVETIRDQVSASRVLAGALDAVRRAREGGDYEQGTRLLADLLSSQPTSSQNPAVLELQSELRAGLVRSKVRAARKVLREGNVETAAEMASKVRPQAMDDPDMLVLDAEIAFKRGRLDEATRIAGQAWRTHSVPDALRIMGLACFYGGRYEEAALWLNKLLSSDPTHRDARLHLPAAEAETGAYADAEADLNTARKLGLNHTLLDAAEGLIEMSRPGGYVQGQGIIRKLRNSKNRYVLSVAKRMEEAVHARLQTGATPVRSPAQQPPPSAMRPSDITFDVAPDPQIEFGVAGPAEIEFGLAESQEPEVTFDTVATPSRPSSSTPKQQSGLLGLKYCPRCGEELPAIRLPADVHEMMWGGWTCEKCGCKVDRKGRAR